VTYDYTQPSIVFAAAGIASMVLTGLVRKAAIARSMLDHPNERSSHDTPTPRGGGVAIAAVILSFIAWSVASGALDRAEALALGVGGVAVAGTGLLDDLKSLPATYRLAIHLSAAIWAISWLGGLPELTTGSGEVYLGLVGIPLAVLGFVWSTNLFNFMDGTDGIAAVEAVSVAGVGGVLLLTRQAGPLAMLSLVIAAACLGFLWYNWSPAKIFMGDVGSGFLGFLLAGVALASEIGGYVPLFIWAILAAAFIVDATITFARRVRHGHWRVAHRSHTYQRLVQAGWSHRRVAISVAFLNAVLGGLAAFATYHPPMMLPTVVGAFVLVIAVYLLVERLRPFSAAS